MGTDWKDSVLLGWVVFRLLLHASSRETSCPCVPACCCRIVTSHTRVTAVCEHSVVALSSPAAVGPLLGHILYTTHFDLLSPLPLPLSLPPLSLTCLFLSSPLSCLYSVTHASMLTLHCTHTHTRVQSDGEWKLLLITEARSVGELPHGGTVYCIERVAIVPLSTDPSMDVFGMEVYGSYTCTLTMLVYLFLSAGTWKLLRTCTMYVLSK